VCQNTSDRTKATRKRGEKDGLTSSSWELETYKHAEAYYDGHREASQVFMQCHRIRR